MHAVERNALVERFLPFIEYIAREMHRRLPRFEYDDLAQVATLAFIEACDRMDPVAIDTPDEARMFRTYIGTRMRGAIWDHVRHLYPKSLRKNFRVLSLDKTIEEFEGDVSRELQARDNPEQEALDELQREEILRELDDRPVQREIIDLQFFQGFKGGEVAQRLNRTRSHIHRTKRTALDRLRTVLRVA